MSETLDRHRFTALSPGAVDRLIVRTEYHAFTGGLVVCAVTMSNGCMIVGEASPMDAADFDEALGQALARTDAMRKITILEGYRRMADGR